MEKSWTFFQDSERGKEVDKHDRLLFDNDVLVAIWPDGTPRGMKEKTE